MSRKYYSYEEILNSIVDPSNVQQKVSFTGTAGSSNAFAAQVKSVVVYATEDCWVKFGANPTAVADDGSSVFVPASNYRPFIVNAGDKLSAIQDSAGGDIHITEGK
jgi:hypothetical protein